MINVHQQGTVPILPTYDLSVYKNDDTEVVYIPIYNLVNAGVPKSALEDKEHKGFGQPRIKHIITVNYFGKHIDCVTTERFVELLAHSETPLGKAVMSETVFKGLQNSTKHIPDGESGKITTENQEIDVYKDSRGVSYFDISGIGATEEDLIKLRKDSEFWRNELLKLEYIELPTEPEFGWHPLTESSKHPESGEDLVNTSIGYAGACP